ncbi:hypothetical protein FNF29_01250 [Cafeteria roenbergensis]|uniref:Uncharacterized protein n=1 Tax=Cafeteria roenbergensis TaxID=33653 RepID=A0A5A8CUS6_CAFRO|nr:hypothetical protein FNF29_01250 [Cafeteria roenbergensis]|eukprot:KAA0156459.1 hypothetical protein FNF29_01250 [Cafeteria roenbergensis]
MDATPAASPTADTVEDQECLDALGRADEASRESALEAARVLSREQQQAQYEEAVHQLNDMLAKAEQFNATCEKLASGSSFLCKDTPAGFTGGVLRDYQQQGVEWLSTKHFLGESGIIADEMGLGKTVQIIAYVSWMRAAPVSDGPVLIVVPLSTLRNWVNEFRKFAPDIPVVEYHGTPEERASLRRRHIPGCPRWAATVPKARRRSSAGSAGSAAARRRGVATMEREDRCAMPVFITTYSLAMNDSAVLGKAVVPWGLLVVDESHRLKNSASRLTEELEGYCWREALSGTQKVILTGTPLQNDLLELWSLCHFVMPLIFADKHAFASVYGFLQLDTVEGRDDVVLRQERDHIVSTLHRLLSRYMLRRTKADVDLELPPKVEVVVYCGMTDVQARIAEGLAQGRLAEEVADMGWHLTPGDSAIAKLVRGAGAKGASALERGLGEAGPVAVSNLHMHLRKVANHPFLFAEPHPPPEDEERDEAASRARAAAARARAPARRGIVLATEAELAELADASSEEEEEEEDAQSDEDEDEDGDDGNDSCADEAAAGSGSQTDESIVESCSKMQVLDSMLRRLKADGHKVLIFSQFARTLEILSDYLELRRPEFGAYEHLDGSTPREERQASMDRFNERADRFAFLLSTRAGGMGINLTGADTVIIYDSDWNPHADSQAEDRAHRIGQTRPVVVYRLVTAGSVEEALVHRANSKRALERLVLRDGRAGNFRPAG